MIILRDYQEELVGGARAALGRGIKRLLLQSPAGSGKTVMASYMVKGALDRGMSSMFLVHREELARQASRTFRTFKIPHGFVMSSMTMDVRAAVKIAMIDTLRNRLDKVPAPRLLFVDECHHAASPTWRKVLDYYAAQGTIIIGLSATPQRLDGRGLDDLFEEMIPGPAVSRLIAAGALSRYVYLAPPSMLDLTSVKQRAGDYAQDQLAEASDKPAIIGDAVEHYKRLLPGKRAIAFAVSIKHSMHIVEMYRAAGIPAEHVDGDTDPLKRVQTIEAFGRGDVKVMSNVGLFGEGFDVPACEGVQMLRATQSLSWHIQACGRAMRPHESKDLAILLDHVDNWKLHGLPDDDREWSLEGRKKKAGKRKETDEEVQVKQCPKCYHVHAPAPVCPRCGHVYEVKGRELLQVDGELREITKEDAAALKAIRAKELEKATTIEQLEVLAMQRGYSPGWASHIMKARKQKQARIINNYRGKT